MKHKNVIIQLDLEDSTIKFAMCRFMVVDSDEGPKLRATASSFGSHESIVSSIRIDEGIEGKVLGGGMLHITPQKREIKACDRSILYGAAPQDVVEQLLANYCAEIGYNAPLVEMGR
ncbi:MAG: hypothetical protein KJ955_06375 [Nanoarchaeota archaeon]|nr:hypothetical protein [Nanoarchaeota archaeon]